MQKPGFLILVILTLSACNNSAQIESKVDSLAKKIDTTADKVWDSTKAGFERLKDKVEDKLDKKDSTGKKKN
jgi:hypothetical protein